MYQTEKGQEKNTNMTKNYGYLVTELLAAQTRNWNWFIKENRRLVILEVKKVVCEFIQHIKVCMSYILRNALKYFLYITIKMTATASANAFVKSSILKKPTLYFPKNRETIRKWNKKNRNILTN